MLKCAIIGGNSSLCNNDGIMGSNNVIMKSYSLHKTFVMELFLHDFPFVMMT